MQHKEMWKCKNLHHNKSENVKICNIINVKNAKICNIKKCENAKICIIINVKMLKSAT